MILDEVTDESIQAWLSAVQQTPTNKMLPKIEGAVLVAEFKQAFKAVKECTSSSPSSLHYSIWEVVACNDDLIEWLSIMMSLPFMYGFVNKRWATIIDVVIKKKKIQEKSTSFESLGSLKPTSIQV